MASGITVPTNAYISLADLKDQKLPKREYSAVSVPTIAQAEKTILKVAAAINAILRSQGYSPPLTNSDDILILSEINALGAAAKIERATLAALGAADSSAIVEYNEMFEAEMKRLQNGEYTFSGAGASDVHEPDVNDELDTGGDREDTLFNTKSPLDDDSF